MTPTGRPSNDGPYLVPALTSAVGLIAILASSATSLSQTELARRAGISKSSAHNLLLTLQHENYVRRDAHSRRYSLGPALIGLGRAAARTHQLLDRAEDEANQLAAALGIQISVVLPARDAAEIIYTTIPPTGLFISAAVGTKIDSKDLTRAVIKCMLSTLPDPQLQSRINAHEAALVAQGIGRDEFLEDIAAARTNGYAVATNDARGIHAVTAPVFNDSEELELMLLALGFPTELTDDKLREVAQELKTAASRVSASAHPGLRV